MSTHSRKPSDREELPQRPLTAPELTDAQCLGTAPLSDGIALPKISLDDPVYNHLTASIFNNLPPYLIFRKGGNKKKFVTVRPGTRKNLEGVYPAEVTDMDARRLCSFLGDRIHFYRGSGEKEKRCPLSKELAEQIMASDEWLNRCEPLELIFPVRLPVWADSKKKRVILAEPGYDPERQVYTVETLNYSMDKRWAPAQLVSIWNRIMCGFPWAPEGEAEELQEWSMGGKKMVGACPSTNRSACCCLALMLGQYVRLLCGDFMPIGIFSANQQGSGKTLLAWLAITPVWGTTEGAIKPKDDQEMLKTIESAVLNGKTFYVLDDINSLCNNAINMIATARQVTGRLLGGNDMFSARNHMQLFATGNNLKTTADVERRALMVDLFMSESALERSFSSPMTQESISRPEWRADLLRFMYSMVMNWSDAGCPRLVPQSAKPSFENYAEIVGSIMVFNKFGSPFRERESESESGDLLTDTIIKFLRRVVSEEMGEKHTVTYTVKELIDFSNDRHYTETIVGDKNPNTSFGRRLIPFRGRKLKDMEGRPFEFGRRKEAGQSAYTFTRLDIN